MKTIAETAGRSTSGLYDLLVGDEDARVCEDIPQQACNDQPKNFFISLGSYFCTKVGDEIASASLVLPWLLGAVGAPALLTGFLVPIREAGALLPQLIFAGFIRPFPVRKWFWIGGSIGQAICVFGMLVAGLYLQGTAGGLAIIILLTFFSLARGISSVASKDVLGKTVSKRRRGTMMGYASALAGIAAAGIGLYFSLRSSNQLEQRAVFILLGGAALLWLLAALLYSFLAEVPGATEGGGNAIVEGLRSIRLLREDKPFRDFVVARALLLGVALSLPFYVALAREKTGGDISGLAQMLVASGLAGSLSAPIWGRMADRSSRQVMAMSAMMSGVLGVALFTLILAGSELVAWPGFYAVLFFVSGISHSGARLGRKTHLVDMATADKRAAYVAVSNTVIGVLILAGGAFGLLAQFAGTHYAVLALALLSLLAARVAATLPEAQ